MSIHELVRMMPRDQPVPPGDGVWGRRSDDESGSGGQSRGQCGHRVGQFWEVPGTEPFLLPGGRKK